MYTIGSVGTVDPRDIGKVVCRGSIVQLGYGVGGAEPAVAAEAPAAQAIGLPQVTAIIRYNVPPEEGFGGNVLGNIALRLRYRDGNGRVLATLIEVAVPVGPGAPGYIAETPLLRFDSEDPNFGGPSSNFRTHITQLELDADQYQHQFDFDGNIYYIALTLSGPEFVLHYPPAVAAIEIIGRQTV